MQSEELNLLVKQGEQLAAEEETMVEEAEVGGSSRLSNWNRWAFWWKWHSLQHKLQKRLTKK